MFDATLNLERRPLDRRGLRRHYGATLRIVALIYAHAAVLKLKGVPWHRRPEVGGMTERVARRIVFGAAARRSARAS